MIASLGPVRGAARWWLPSVVADSLIREHERRFLADPTDPLLLDAAIAARRRAGEPIGDLLARRRYPARVIEETGLTFEVHVDGRKGGSTPGRVELPVCAGWSLAPRPAKLTPQVIGRLRALEAPGLHLQPATGLRSVDLEALADCNQLTHLFLGTCSKLDGGALGRLSALPRLDTVGLHSAPPLDLSSLAELPRLSWLTLHWSRPLPPGGLKPLGTLPLERLSLWHTKWLDDEMVGHAPPSLRSLSLEGCPKVHGATLGRLARLESLNVSGVGLNKAGLAELSSLPFLRSLDLSTCDARTLFDRPGALAPLARLPRLDTLALGPNVFPRQDFEWLRGVPTLRALKIGVACDAHLAALRDHPGLEVLDLWVASRDISAGGLAQLASLPRLRALSLHGWVDRESAPPAVAALPEVGSFPPVGRGRAFGSWTSS